MADKKTRKDFDETDSELVSILGDAYAILENYSAKDLALYYQNIPSSSNQNERNKILEDRMMLIKSYLGTKPKSFRQEFREELKRGL